MPVRAVDAICAEPELLSRASASDRIIKVAHVVLAGGRYSWVWVVPECPYCGKPHDHYGGPLDGNPYMYLGQVFAARCDQTDRRRLGPQYPPADLRYVLANTAQVVA